MKTFSMSEYKSKEELFEARSSYYEGLCYRLLYQLESDEKVYRKGNDYYWKNTKKRVDDGF